MRYSAAAFNFDRAPYHVEVSNSVPQSQIPAPVICNPPSDANFIRTTSLALYYRATTVLAVGKMLDGNLRDGRRPGDRDERKEGFLVCGSSISVSMIAVQRFAVRAIPNLLTYVIPATHETQTIEREITVQSRVRPSLFLSLSVCL